MLKISYSCICISILLLSGCRTRTYYWGSYEQNIYNIYMNPGKADPESLIIRMEADVEKARAADKPLPPGFHAQLGYLYFKVGKTDLARSEFILEKEQFPESAVLMERFIKQIEGRK